MIYAMLDDDALVLTPTLDPDAVLEDASDTDEDGVQDEGDTGGDDDFDDYDDYEDE